MVLMISGCNGTCQGGAAYSTTRSEDEVGGVLLLLLLGWWDRRGGLEEGGREMGGPTSGRGITTTIAILRKHTISVMIVPRGLDLVGGG